MATPPPPRGSHLHLFCPLRRRQLGLPQTFPFPFLAFSIWVFRQLLSWPPGSLQVFDLWLSYPDCKGRILFELSFFRGFQTPISLRSLAYVFLNSFSVVATVFCCLLSLVWPLLLSPCPASAIQHRGCVLRKITVPQSFSKVLAISREHNTLDQAQPLLLTPLFSPHRSLLFAG